VVVIGGGVIGCSVAYHLARRGVSDVVLLERKALTSGTTWHAAGLVAQLRATQNMTKLARYSAELYESLAAETGQETGFRRTGSLSVATHAERLEELLRGASMARCFGLEVEVLAAKEIAERHPLVETADLVGGVYLPGDASTSPVDTTLALAAGAKARGATILDRTQVTGVLQENGRVLGASTAEGDVEAPIVVNAAGMWARAVGQMCGVNVPLHAAEHFYVITEPIADPTQWLPTLRDPDGCAYYKFEAGGQLLIGFFEPVAKPWGMDGIPESFEFDQLPDDWEHLEPELEGTMRRIPKLRETGIRLFFNGPESFTPDDRYLLGEAPSRRAARARCSPIGSSMATRRWTSGTSTCGACCPSRETTHTCAHGPSRQSDCSTPCTGPFASTRPRAVSAPPRCTAVSPLAAPASVSWRAGSARTGSRRARRRPATSTRTGARTGSSTPRPSIAPSGRPSASSTRAPSAS
jgi:4-methylaminobutanoate oxidase (formaldehyde-forming)